VTESIRATRAAVQIGSITVDGFMLPDGSYRMSQTQAAECVGKPEINARRFLSSRFLEGKPFALIDVETPCVMRGATRIRAVSFDQVVEYWQHQVRLGNQKAVALLTQLSRNVTPGLEQFKGMRVVSVARQRVKREQDYEKWYVNQLQVEMGGETEVLTPAGSIDLLTTSQLIEVKHIKNWKTAIGQVLVYSAYYPSHEKRIHLFGNCHESFLDTVKQHCQRQNIVLTWEL
jgi:hypothetical protein